MTVRVRKLSFPWDRFVHFLEMEHGVRHHSMMTTVLLGEGINMRTTIALDDELVAEAQELTGLKEKSALVREALKALIALESARRIALLGGTQPDLTVPPRRRPEPA